MALIYLVELTIYNGGSQTLRYADGEGYNHSSAPGFYAGRLRGMPTFFAEVSADPREAGPRTSLGDLLLKNEDGALTATFLQAGVAGHAVTILLGDSAAAYGTFETVLTAVMLEPQVTRTDIVIPLRDRGVDLEVPMGGATFAGTNAGSTGVEGNADDIKGQRKPVAYGKVRVALPPFVNTSRPIQQLHDGNIEDIDAGYDKGVVLTKGAARSFASIDVTADPGAGQFDYHLGVSATSAAYVRLVSTEARSGPIFYTLQGDKRGGTYRTSAADLFAEWAAQRVTNGPATVTADITALNAVSSAICGFFNREDLTVAEAFNRLLPSVNGKWWLSATGDLRVRQLTAPTGTPVANFRRFGVATAAIATDVDIVSYELLPPELPIVWKVTVLYQPFWHTQTDGLDANVAQGLRSSLMHEYRRTDPAEDASIKTTYPGAIELEVRTLLDAEADAETLRDLIFDLFSVRRDPLKLSVRLNGDLAGVIDIGAQVKTFDILDYGAVGRAQTVLGRGLFDRQARLMQVKVWG